MNKNIIQQDHNNWYATWQWKITLLEIHRLKWLVFSTVMSAYGGAGSATHFSKDNQNAHDWAAFGIATAQSIAKQKKHQSIKGLLATIVP